MNSAGAEEEEVDLYEVLLIDRGASKAEVKKAYHKAALSSHPDKVPEDRREEAETRFKLVQQAYDILSDDQTRHLYDTQGMSAFKRPGGAGPGPEVDLEDMLNNMFGGMGMGGMGGMPGMDGMPGGSARRRGPRKGTDETQVYEVSLEELYKGKTTKFASTKQIICEVCKGTGGKDKAKSQQCSGCKGQGQRLAIRQTPFGMMQEPVTCSSCDGAGSVFRDKDRCKKCKGQRTVQVKKMLELYIPRGSREGDRIVLQGEADQQPEQEPGDIVFVLKETDHETFARAGNDLAADVAITLAEALTGLSRVVVTHLDGRGISLSTPKGKILRPQQILKISGEGMPIKRSDAKGDLYLTVNVSFPEDGYFIERNQVEAIRNLLPAPESPIKAEEVEDCEFEEVTDMEDFGAGTDDPRRDGAHWEDADDDDEEMGGQAQCAQQ